MSPYSAALLPDRPSVEDLRSVLSDYETISLVVMGAIADRFDRAPDYPFIDTKLDLISGVDFPESDSIRGRNAVYGWIQGRGIEALAGHAAWMRDTNIDEGLRERLGLILRSVLDQVRRVRDRNRGKLSFFMSPDGQPFTLSKDGEPDPFELSSDHPYGFSDLFASKGIYAAGVYLEDEGVLSEAREYVLSVETAIWDGTFLSDQISLDPKNPVEPRTGYHAHGHYMIQIGAAALLAECGEADAAQRGLRLIEHEFANHTNVDARFAEFQPGDFWEGLDDEGNPYRDDGRVLSDPGHALECVGLSGRFLDACRKDVQASPANVAAHERTTRALHPLLAQNFANGHLDPPGGLCKAFDLVGRQCLNTDLPWWNLPETIRAAAYCARFASNDDERQAACRIFAACHNAFTRNFVRPDLHLMSYQTIDERGTPVAVIPATADADPGYHTGLSLIDTIRVVKDL